MSSTQELKRYADHTFFENGKTYTIEDEGKIIEVNIQGQGLVKRLTFVLSSIAKPVIFNNTSWKACEHVWGPQFGKWKGHKVRAKIASTVIAGREVTPVYFTPV